MFIASITRKIDNALEETIIADSADGLYSALRKHLFADAPTAQITSLHDILSAVEYHPLLNTIAISISTDHDSLRSEPGVVLLNSLGHPSPSTNGIPTILATSLAYAAEQAEDTDEECLILDDVTPSPSQFHPILTLPGIGYAQLTPHNPDNILTKPISERIAFIAPLISHLTNQSVKAAAIPADISNIQSLGVISTASDSNTSTCLIVAHCDDNSIAPIMTVSGIEFEEQKIMIFQIVNLISTGRPHC